MTTKTQRIYKVHMDSLRKAISPVATGPLHPSLQRPGEDMDTYDYDKLERYLLHSAVETALAMGVRSSQASTESVQVYR